MKEYNHVSLEERKNIYIALQEGLGIRAIARKIGRNASTISREVSRNAQDIGYLPDTADTKAKNRKAHRKKCIESNELLQDYIIKGMRSGWSPEQIAGRMKLERRQFYAAP
jgi:transposase, IS30 family